jgi:ABC-type antimicrobial peptide transport system permease subunit
VLVLIVWISGEAGLGFVFRALLISSTLMLVVGLLACVGPATRALRIHPTEALRET